MVSHAEIEISKTVKSYKDETTSNRTNIGKRNISQAQCVWGSQILVSYMKRQLKPSLHCEKLIMEQNATIRKQQQHFDRVKNNNYLVTNYAIEILIISFGASTAEYNY